MQFSSEYSMFVTMPGFIHSVVSFKFTRLGILEITVSPAIEPEISQPVLSDVKKQWTSLGKSWHATPFVVGCAAELIAIVITVINRFR